MYGKRQESGLIGIIPLMCLLTIYSQHPAFLQPGSPPGAPSGMAARADDGLMAATLFVD